MVVCVPLALLLGAVVLRTACKVTGVKMPSLALAFGVVVVTALAGGAASFIINVLCYVALSGLRDPATIRLLASLINLPISMVIAATIYSKMLKRVSFSQGILIWFVELLILIAVGAVLGAIAFVVSLGTARRF
jgi:hypothetical protein